MSKGKFVKIGRKNYFSSPRHNRCLVASMGIGILISKLAGFWVIGLVWGALMVFIIALQYLNWNRQVNDTLNICGPHITVETAYQIANRETGYSGGPPKDVFFDASNAGLPYNVWHKD